jgi:hypothetical protein
VIIGTAPGITTVAASVGGLNASAAITIVSPVYSVTAAPVGSASVSGNSYTLNIKVTDSGNVPVSAVTLAGVLLNSTATASTAPVIASLNPGAGSSFSFAFPATAGAHGTTASLRITGAYTIALPGGGTRSESFSTGARLLLP